MLRVCEIFKSIQGESSYAGWPCTFVRLTGCNLRCVYCDTKYAYDEGGDRTIAEIVTCLGRYDCSLVTLTGGEPLIQSETPDLIEKLLDGGYTVLLETNGSQDISCVDQRCVRVVDFKCPSSGESNSNDFKNIDRLRPHDEVKFVLGDRKDYDYARESVCRIRYVHGPGNTILFSPIYEVLDPRTLASWMMDDGLEVRLNLQLHKYIWGPHLRGV